MSLHVKDVDRAWAKLNMRVRDSKDKHAFFEHDGKVIIKTKRSLGSGSIEGPVQYLIRQQMKLNETEFSDLISCPLNRDGYIDILKRKRLIE